MKPTKKNETIYRVQLVNAKVVQILPETRYILPL